MASSAGRCRLPAARPRDAGADGGSGAGRPGAQGRGDDQAGSAAPGGETCRFRCPRPAAGGGRRAGDRGAGGNAHDARGSARRAAVVYSVPCRRGRRRGQGAGRGTSGRRGGVRGHRRATRAAMGIQDPGLITAQLSAWLLAQDWDAVIDGPQGVFLVTYTGHVGLCAGEPFTDGPALTILAPSCTGCSPTSSRRCCRRRTGPGRSARRPAAGRRRAVQTAMSKSSWAPTESPQSGRPGLQAPVRDR